MRQTRKTGGSAAKAKRTSGRRIAATQDRSTGQKHERLKTLSDIRRFFFTSERPVYFFSATCFNLLGIEEWIPALRHVNTIDCFDGRNPRVFVPREIPHETFTSIEDITNYLLEHKEVHDLVIGRRRGGPAGQAIFLMFDARTEELCRDLELDVCFPAAALRQEVDSKLGATRIANRAGVESVPNVLARVDSYATLRRVSASLGPELVVQTAFGDSGHTTFFISREEDWKRYAAEITRDPEVKVMKRIRCRGAAMEACVTRHGTLVGPLMTELVGFPELTPYKGGWCGNELFPNPFSSEIRERAREASFRLGQGLKEKGYRGYFEVDFLLDLDSNHVYLGEVNPRITGASFITNMAAFGHSDAPLFLFHLLEWSGIDYDLDVQELNERWARAESVDAWSQLVLKHTVDEVDLVTRAPESGIYRIDRDGHVEFVTQAIHRRSVTSEDEAFFFRIVRSGDYRYEGADLGIVVSRGRFMDEEHRLTDRARNWITGFQALYAAAPLDVVTPPRPAPLLKGGRFKLF